VFDSDDKLPADLLAAVGQARSEISAREPFGADHRSVGRGKRRTSATGRRDLPAGGGFPETELDSLRDLVSGLLPWVSKSSGEPVGMWIEAVGRVDSRFEPYPLGTPFVWVAAASWDAAEAVYEALAPVARLDDARWVAGWQEFAPGVRKIKIYPVVPSSSGA
jgi:hypothetical protein